MTRDPNWAQAGPLIPLATLAGSYDGPVLLADETQTIRWFVPKGGNRGEVDHVEHKRDAEGAFMHGGDDQPVTESRKVQPAFWAMVEVAD